MYLLGIPSEQKYVIVLHKIKVLNGLVQNRKSDFSE